MGSREDSDTEATIASLEPRRRRAIENFTVPLDNDQFACLVAKGDDVALANAIARDVYALAVDIDVSVANKLTSLRTSRCPTGAVHDIVETQLEEPEHVLAGHTLATVRFLVEVAELLLGKAVGETRLLLFLHLEQVLAGVATTTRTSVLTWRVWALLEGNSFALGAKDVGAEATRNACLGSGITSHVQTLRRLG